MKKIVSLALAGLVLTGIGCSSTLKQIKKDDVSKTVKLKQKHIESELSKTPSIVKVPISKDAFVIKEPESVNIDRQITIQIKDTLENILSYISQLEGINIVIEPEIGGKTRQGRVNYTTGSFNTPSVDTNSALLKTTLKKQNQIIYINFKGKLSDLFKLLSEQTGYFFVYENNAVVVKREETFNVLIPSYPKLLDTVKGNLEKLGAKSIGFDNISSTLTFTADYRAFEKIKDYLKKIRENASLITLRIVLLSVSLNKEKNLGIDWSKLAFGYRSQKLAVQNPVFGATLTGTTTGTLGTTTNNNIETFSGNGISLLFNQTGTNLFIEGSNFALNTFLSMIETYGKYNLMQNVFIQSLSGSKGKIEVLREIPFISQVSVAVTGTVGNALSSAQTDKAKTGVEMEILPFYDKKSKMLSINLKVGIYETIRFINLSAGGQLGQFSQPETAKKVIETQLYMKASQVAIIGGLIYNQEGSQVSGLPIDSYLTKTNKSVKNKEELVIIVKPTVIEFVPEDK